jgi:hypothetical protein
MARDFRYKIKHLRAPYITRTHSIRFDCAIGSGVIGHEAVLMDPKLFSSWVHRSVVLLKRRSGRQTSSRWRFSRKNDWVVQVIRNSAARDKGHTGALYSKNSDRATEAGMALFTTALGLYALRFTAVHAVER